MREVGRSAAWTAGVFAAVLGLTFALEPVSHTIPWPVFLWWSATAGLIVSQRQGWFALAGLLLFVLVLGMIGEAGQDCSDQPGCEDNTSFWYDYRLGLAYASPGIVLGGGLRLFWSYPEKGHPAL